MIHKHSYSPFASVWHLNFVFRLFLLSFVTFVHGRVGRCIGKLVILVEKDSRDRCVNNSIELGIVFVGTFEEQGEFGFRWEPYAVIKVFIIMDIVYFYVRNIIRAASQQVPGTAESFRVDLYFKDGKISGIDPCRCQFLFSLDIPGRGNHVSTAVHNVFGTDEFIVKLFLHFPGKQGDRVD